MLSIEWPRHLRLAYGFIYPLNCGGWWVVVPSLVLSPVTTQHELISCRQWLEPRREIVLLSSFYFNSPGGILISPREKNSAPYAFPSFSLQLCEFENLITTDESGAVFLIEIQIDGGAVIVVVIFVTATNND